ncbi:MAG: helix-hairpin-helix domain-containing protein [Prevotella sp.]|nr:helix-hairpin-helix domain-containing protein [Prevotella sp.]
MNRNDRRIALGAVCVGLLALLGLWLGGETAPDTTNAIAPTDSTPTIPNHPTSPNNPTTPTTPTNPTKTPSPYYTVPSHAVERFPFDPNTADSTQLLRLGLQPWQVRNIYKYRAHGGIYRKKEDFAQLYGLTVKQYRELEPYIRISKDYLPASTLVGNRDLYPVKIGENEHIVLNTADTTELQRVPGIGPYYAKEIVRRGKWLGGYVSVDQLDEIENFPQEAKKYFVIQDATPKKLNVNKLGLQELRKHPYINYYMAKTIVDYRRLHGPIKSLEDLHLSKDFPPEVIRRLSPYVEY